MRIRGGLPLQIFAREYNVVSLPSDDDIKTVEMRGCGSRAVVFLAV